MTYLKLDYPGLIEKNFPKSIQKIIEWFCNREDIIEGLIGISGEGATVEEVKAAFQQVVPVIIQHDPRKLYEFFDDQKIIISISSHPDFEDHFIHYNSVSHHSFTANNRMEAEEAAFIDAFKILEKKLAYES